MARVVESNNQITTDLERLLNQREVNILMTFKF